MEPEIRLKGRRFDFTVPLGRGIVIPTGGGAMIEEEDRPEDTSLSVYKGNALIRLAVPVFFDGWPNRNIYPKVEQVLNLCVGRNGNPPPNFTASGPMPFSGTRFQMDGFPEWGDGTGRRGNWLVRQELTVKLVEFEDPDAIRFRRKKKNRIGISRGVALTAVTVKGDTLLKIAARFYGNPARAHDIAKLNGIRDVRKQLAPGRTLKLKD